ncbi:hypothetical protein [Streptomyces sp. NPDC001508]|uniref:hypothetical protein n=1 Tax=Streptomyces sp. NPDC001508 TaxID=3154656 RepID=UPI003323BC1F
MPADEPARRTVPESTSSAVRLADEVAHQLGQLTERLSQLPSEQAAQILARVLDPDEGVLGRFTGLLITGSYFTKNHAERGLLPAEVWLALGRAANELNDIGLDLDPHIAALAALGTRPAPATPSVAAPLVARRHR